MTDIRDDVPRAHPATTSPSLTSIAASGIAEALARALSGRYDIQQEIGRGGSAIVFLAHDRARHENVAIKVLRPEFAHALYADRFVREVEIARRLEHPSILPLLESGTLGELPYFVMPYVEGDTLRDRLHRDRHLTIEDALRIACSVAETLDYAHRVGLVHRDIKPANILLGPNGVVVADFGIARAIAESAVLGPAAITVGTPSGVAIGTPEYMSPEQATADSAVDGRADVYSLGCVLYEMLAGEPPFSGASPQAIVAKHLHQPPPALRVVRPTITLAVQRTIEKALAKVPADRYATAGDFAAALAAAPDEESAAPLPSRGRRALAAVAIVAVTALAVTLLAPRAASAWRRHAAGVHYESGVAALERWDLTEADSAFRRASERDPGDPRTFLNLALVRAWRGAAPGQWRYAAERAAQAGGQLSVRDGLVVAALSQQAIGRRDVACDRWRELTRRAPREFVGWYGLSDCLFWDSVVVRDTRDARTWRFRSSSQDALRALDRAIELRESVSGTWVSQVRRLLPLNPTRVRAGRATPPDTTTFVAWPSWAAETLAFEPLPAALFDQSNTALASNADQAALHTRQRFHAIARMWRARFPESADALESVALSLDLLANPGAFDTLQVVRQRARTDADRVRLGVLEVILRTKYCVPDGLECLRQARRLADSLLRVYPPTSREQAGPLGSLAALTGRAGLAARYARLSLGATVNPALEASAPILLAYASLGAPADSLRAHALATQRGIANGVVADERDGARAEWMVRSALLSLPDSTVALLLPLGAQPPLDLLSAWREHDLAAVNQILTQWRSDPRRKSLHASDLTIDALYSEAAALASLGDARAAIATLAPTLDSLALVAPQRLSDVPRVGALVRAMMLRARLAADINDSGSARRWSSAALILWSDADDFLNPALEPLRRLVPQQ